MGSLSRTVVVKVVLPLLRFALTMSLPSKVTSKLPRSLLSASRVTVMVLPAFAKLSPEELAILSDNSFVTIDTVKPVIRLNGDFSR